MGVFSWLFRSRDKPQNSYHFSGWLSSVTSSNWSAISKRIGQSMYGLS